MPDDIETKIAAGYYNEIGYLFLWPRARALEENVNYRFKHYIDVYLYEVPMFKPISVINNQLNNQARSKAFEADTTKFMKIMAINAYE